MAPAAAPTRLPLPSLREAPAAFYGLVLLEVWQSDLFRAINGQSIGIAIGPRQSAEILTILSVFGLLLFRLKDIALAVSALPGLAKLALAFYLACVATSIPVSLNPGLSLLRTVEWLDYAAVAVLWGTALRRTRPDDFADAVADILLVLCRFFIGLQCLTALVHYGEADVGEILKSNLYSIPCALLAAITLATKGLKPSRGLGTAVFGLLLFQSLTSVLAALVSLLWLFLEQVVLRRDAVFLRARLVMLAALMFGSALAYPVAVVAVEQVGQMMGRDAASISNFTGRAELWHNLIGQITEDPSRFKLGLGYGVGERVYVQKFNEDFKRDMREIGINDVTIHSHSHNLILSAIINIGFLGALAVPFLYLGLLLKPTIRRAADARAAFQFVLVAAIQAVSTNLFASADVLALVYLLMITMPRAGDPRVDRPGRRHAAARAMPAILAERMRV